MPVSVDDPFDDDDVDSDASEGEVNEIKRQEEAVDGDASVLMSILMRAPDHHSSVDRGFIEASSSGAASDPSWESSDDNDEGEDDAEDDDDVEDDSEDQEEDYDDDFEDIDHDDEDQELDDVGEMDNYVDEERGYRWSASQSASSSCSYSTESASSSSYSSSEASSAGASDGSQKRRGSGTRNCCPRKRCLWQTAVLVVVLAVPLGMVYRFYRSRHPSNGQEGSNRQSATSLPFLNMSSSSSSAPPSPQPSTADSPTAAPVRSSSSYVPTARTGSNHTSSDNHTSTSHSNATTMLCNGHANLCSIPANQVLFATLHNGHAAYDNGFTIFPNHQQSLEDAVNAGFRGINVDVGRCDNSIELTHTYCFLGTRDPVQVFTNLDAWLDDNPNEVLLMPVQIDIEAGGLVSMEEVWDVLTQSGNFVNKLYVHNDTMSSSTTPSEYTYPTLRELIEKNQRVLFFIYNGEESCADLKAKKEEQEQATSTNWTARLTSGSSSTGFVCPDGMYDWFGTGAAAETEYDFATLQDIQDVSNSCRITRGNAVNAPFFGVNVFLSIPTPETSSYLNSADFLGPHLESCMQVNNRTFVSAVMVDFWDRGDVLEVVYEYNSKL